MKRVQKEVEVVVAPSHDFPSSFPLKLNSIRRSHQKTESNYKKVDTGLDLRETMKEVHAMGSTLFEGKQKKDYEAVKYKTLTGRDKKQQRVPLKIRRGIQKKASEREARRLAEAKEAGIVLKSTAPEKKTREISKYLKSYGPVPSIGYTKKGILRVPKSMGNSK